MWYKSKGQLKRWTITQEMEGNDQLKWFKLLAFLDGMVEIKALACYSPENNVTGMPWKCITEYWMTVSKYLCYNVKVASKEQK